MTFDPKRRDFLRASIATGFAIGAGGILIGCGSDDDDASTTSTTKAAGGTTTVKPAELTELTAMMPFPLYLAFIADCTAKAGGFLEKEGIDLDLQFARSAPQALQTLASGKATVIRNAPIGLVKAVSGEGAPFISIATANQGIIYTLVSSPAKPVAELADLAGKTIGLATLAGNAEDTLDLVLKAKGIDPTTVKRQAVGNEATAYALIEGNRIDAIFATREATATMKAEGIDFHVNELTDTNPLLGTSIVTTKDAIAERRDDLVAYLRGVHAAMEAILDPAELDSLLPVVNKEYPDLKQLADIEKVKPVIAGISSAWTLAGPENLLRNVPERWETGVEAFKKMKIAKPEAKATDFYTNDLIDEALS